MSRFSKPPQTWADVLGGYPEAIQAITLDLRDVVRRSLPDATETVRGAKIMGYAQYWLDNPTDVLAMIAPEDEHVKLYVHHVHRDATGRLKIEGSGKHARHVKLVDVDDDAVAALLAQVLAVRSGK